MVNDFGAETSKLLVSLFNLLVKSLVLDLELFVIDKMETFSKLLLLLKNLFLVGQSVSQSDVLEAGRFEASPLPLPPLLPEWTRPPPPCL